MKKLILAAGAVLLLATIMIPHIGFTEDADTVLLARSIYALAKDESYETKLAIGTVVMNRVENPWFGETLGEVLNEQHQFPAGRRYDAESLSAAHDVLSGARVLDESALYYQANDASEPVTDKTPVKTIGAYTFLR